VSGKLFVCNARLTGNASGNDNDISASEGLLHALAVLGQVSGHGLSIVSALHVSKQRKSTYRGGGDVREIGGDAGRVDDIVEGKLIDERRCLEKKGQWLRGGE
jgi:hypothetical protein